MNFYRESFELIKFNAIQLKYMYIVFFVLVCCFFCFAFEVDRGRLFPDEHGKQL